MRVLMTGVAKERLGGMWTVANNYISSKEYNENVELTYIPTSTNGSIAKRILLMIKAFIKIKKALSKKNIDLVHIHMAEKGSTFRASKIVKYAKKYKTKVIIHLHAGPFLDWYDSLNKRKQKSIKEMFNQTSCVLVLGEYWKEKLAPLVSEDKIRVLYNGVDVPDRNYYNSSSKNIVYFGVMNKNKGIYDLIAAIEKIDDELEKDIKVKLCGKDLVGNIQETIDKKELSDRIECLGWIDGDKKEKILKDSAISILPSYFEALSMTVIEAMSYGIPIITTKISTMNEVLHNEELLFEPGDYNTLGNMIIKLLNDKEKREKISNDLYSRSKEVFASYKMIENTLKIYEECL